MSIWSYNYRSPEPERFSWWETVCAFCKAPLLDLESETTGGVQSGFTVARVSVCNQCGWFRAHRVSTSISGVHRNRQSLTYAAAASLRELDLTDISTPIDEVRDYLVARFESRKAMNPRLFEETVGSVFRDLGWNARVTAYSGDDGIDVFLDKDEKTVGVQVKRYRSSIEVEQIRALAGALLLEGLTKGIFVTTSSFQRGATETVRRYESKGYKIELVDSNRLFDALQLAQREKYGSRRDFPEGLLNNLPLIKGTSVDMYRGTRLHLEPKTWTWSRV